MAHSIYSPSPSPPVLSPTYSDSSDNENDSNHSEYADGFGPSVSRPGSPAPLDDPAEADTVTCQWEDCGIVFTHLPTLIEHIHNGEWTGISKEIGVLRS